MADREWANALRLAVKRPYENDAEKRVCLDIIAEKCINAAIGGDMSAVKEIGDRLDGKPHQSSTNTHEVGASMAEVFERLMDRNAGR